MADEHTTGPWVEFADQGNTVAIMPAMRAGDVCTFAEPFPARANARLMVAAPDLLEAAQLLEAAEHARQFCEECEDDGEPEACGTCFPAFDDARVKRRLAIVKATGRQLPQDTER